MPRESASSSRHLVLAKPPDWPTPLSRLEPPVARCIAVLDARLLSVGSERLVASRARQAWRGNLARASTAWVLKVLGGPQQGWQPDPCLAVGNLKSTWRNPTYLLSFRPNVSRQGSNCQKVYVTSAGLQSCAMACDIRW